jgi:hypothetical protein
VKNVRQFRVSDHSNLIWISLNLVLDVKFFECTLISGVTLLVHKITWNLYIIIELHHVVAFLCTTFHQSVEKISCRVAVVASIIHDSFALESVEKTLFYLRLAAWEALLVALNDVELDFI